MENSPNTQKPQNNPNTTKKSTESRKFAGHNQGELKAKGGRIHHQIITEEGKEVDKEDADEKTALMNMYQEELKIKAVSKSKCIVKLLKLLRTICYQSNRTKVHPPTNLAQVLCKCFSTPHQDNKPVAYVKSIKETFEVLKTLGGNTAVDHAVEQQFIANLIVEGSNNSMQLKQTIATNYSLQHDQYPITPTLALDMMLVHSKTNKISNSQGKGQSIGPNQGRKQNNKQDDKSDNTSTAESSVFITKGLFVAAVEGGEDFGENHNAYQFFQLGTQTLDPEEDTMPATTASTASSTLTLSPPDLIPPTNKDNNSQASTNNDSQESIPTTVSFTTNTLVEYKSFFNHRHKEPTEAEHYHYNKAIQWVLPQATPGAIEKDWTLLDSKSSINLTVNQQMIKNVHKAPSSHHMNIHCNSGVARTNLMGTLPGFGPVWFYPEGIDIENAIYVHKGKNSTIESTNEKEYSNLGIRRAKEAHKIQETLDFPTTEEELIQMSQKNLIKNYDLTNQDINLMTKVCGKHEGILKGKIVLNQPPYVQDDISPVPKDMMKKYKEVTLCAYIININGQNFVVPISGHLKFPIKATIGQYKSRGFKDDLLGKTNPVTVHSVPAGQHEPSIKYSNLTVKENLLQSVFNNLPITTLPKRCVIKMVHIPVFWQNCSRTTSVCETTPIRELMTRIPCGMATMGKFQFLQYIQAPHHEDTDNTLKPRTQGASLLIPQTVFNKLGGTVNLQDMLPTGINMDDDDTKTEPESDSEQSWSVSTKPYVSQPDESRGGGSVASNDNTIQPDVVLTEPLIYLSALFVT
eukprot:jgi/Psemu1/2723/gm1.2723_g